MTDAADLGVEERVGHAEHHLVTKLRATERVAVHKNVGHGPTLTRISGMDPYGRALELVDVYDAELRELLPDGAEIFDAHLHLGHDIDGMVGDYDRLEQLMARYGVSRAFVFCLTSPTGTRAFAPPTTRTLAFAERSEGRLVPFCGARPERDADRGGDTVPRPRCPRHQAAPPRARTPARAARRSRRRDLGARVELDASRTGVEAPRRLLERRLVQVEPYERDQPAVRSCGEGERPVVRGAEPGAGRARRGRT